MLLAGSRFILARELYKILDKYEGEDEISPVESEIEEVSTAVVRIVKLKLLNILVKC